MRSTSDWNIILTVLLCIAVLIIYDFKCNGKKPKNVIKTDTVVTYITQVDTFYRTKLKPVYRTHVDTFKRIDTVSIIKEYNTLNVYSDTLSDSNYKVVILDTLFRNSIYSRTAQVSITHKNTIVTNTILPRSQWLVGGQVSAPQFSIVPVIHYQRDKDVYGVGYNPFNRSITLGYSRKIFSK